MATNVEITKISPRRYVGVRRTVKHDGIGPACGELLPRLSAWLSEKGIQPDGPPAVVYHSFDRETGNFSLEPALFVTAEVEGEGDISVSETPGGEALTALHVGPYSTLGQTWDAIFAYAEKLNRKLTKRSWELYLNDPRTAAPDELRTQIFAPLD
jgi:effector-binding domain-containing protein